MHNINITIFALIIGAAFLAIGSEPVYAAEARLNMKARIVRCVTPQERRHMCESENLCCNLVDMQIALQQGEEVEDNVTLIRAEHFSFQDAGYSASLNRSKQEKIISIE